MNTNDSFNQTKTVTARIVSVHKNRFQIALDSAERKAAEHDAVLAGRLLYRGEIPVVGDYIEAEFETSPSESLSVMRELFRYCRAKV